MTFWRFVPHDPSVSIKPTDFAASLASLHQALAGVVKPPPLDDRVPELLSTREREVLACLAQGRSNREIAAALSVTLATVKSHLVHIYSKLGATNRNECLGRAVSLGLLQ